MQQRRLKTALTTSLGQEPSVSLPLIFRNGVLAAPVDVPGRVDLEIAAEEMRALVAHESLMPSWASWSRTRSGPSVPRGAEWSAT